MTERRQPQGVIDFSALNPGVSELQQVADESCARLSAFKGCSEECRASGKPACCRDKIVSQSEFDLIASSVHTSDLYAYAAEAMSRDRQGWCPFLGPDGACRVYEYRPLECRLIGTIEPAPTSCKEPEKVTAAQLSRRIDVRDALYRIRAALAGNGPRRPLTEWLVEMRQQRDAITLERRLPRA